MTDVILDEHDTDRLLRILYNGTRPARVHTLNCACGSIADLRLDTYAWNGWQVIPHPKCPVCLALERATLVYAPSPERARDQFLQKIQDWNSGKEG